MDFYYFILTQDFFDQYQGYTKDNNQFNAIQDIQGRRVCSINSVIEFPEIFENNSFTIVKLTDIDFPSQEE